MIDKDKVYRIIGNQLRHKDGRIGRLVSTAGALHLIGLGGGIVETWSVDECEPV